MRVSATLIVRNESGYIEECLDSLVGVVDEIVVVDTGSHDDTIEKASRYPVNLCSFAWCDDFSAARNYALDQACGEWILYIDADERLVAPDRRLWDEVLADDNKVAWRLRFYPRVDWPPYAELRLFRNNPRIRFRGVIHENINDSIYADGRDVGRCDLALQHVGYEADQEHKLPRNIPLLEKYVREEPGRVYCWWHLGDMLELSGDDDGAANAWRKGIEIARGRPRQVLSNSLPFVSLIMLQLDTGRLEQDLLDEALRLFPEHLFLQCSLLTKSPLSDSM
ncbi:MAG: glycosyltransferase [bacterium]|nr:glycosyltransferase [bacterium]